MTVAILDLLSKGSLTGGHAIATTGTIDAYGNVGEVGGVAQKTIAVENAGVKYFSCRLVKRPSPSPRRPPVST